MKAVAALTLPILAQVSVASDVKANPVAKVVELLEGMEKKVNNEVEETKKTFEEASKFCEKRTSDLSYALKTNKGEKEELEATISKSSSKIESMAAVIEESMQTIEKSQADLKAATDVRKTESADFKVEEKDLVDTMSTIEKAISVLQQKAGAASLLQVEKAPSVLEAIDAMVSASVINSQSRAGLTALIQKANSEDSDYQPPAVAAYEKKNSNSVVEMLEDLFAKAKDELVQLRKKEAEAVGNFAMLSQSLNDSINFAEKDVTKSKATSNENAATKADSEKQLTETTASIKADSKDLKDLTMDCKRKASDYKVEQKDNADEIEALGVAKKALVEKASGASGQIYDFVQEEPSFLQVNTAVRSKVAQAQIVQVLRKLAHKEDSKEISLLAARVGATIRSGGPFDSIIKMIKDMVAKMQKSLDEDTTKKAYCDAEMAKAKSKEEDKSEEVDKLTSKMDKASSASAQLKSQVKELEASLIELAKSSKEMAEVRASEKAAFDKAKPELEGGLEGVKIALKVLRDYYAGKDKGTGIIGMLEVCEEDFAKSLSERKVAEKTAAADFEKETNEMKLEKTRNEQGVKFKTEEAARIDKELIELKSDSDSVNAEMDAILKFKAGIEDECTEKKESFAEKAAKRQAEIDGLKEALKTLGGEEAAPAAAFLQINRRGNLRLTRQ